MDEENLWKIYDANKEWIKFADAKAIAFIAIIGVIFNILFKISSNVFYLDNILIYIFYSGSIICLLCSLFYSVYCLLPKKSDSKKNIIYYESIYENFKTEKDYHKEIDNIDINSQLSSQVYQLAKVAHEKYSIVKKSLILFAIGILLILILGIIFLGVYFNV